jgi:hypothetical protein
MLKHVFSVGDSEMDLSMHVDGSRFIGFNPTRDSSIAAFNDADIEWYTVRICVQYFRSCVCNNHANGIAVVA